MARIGELEQRDRHYDYHGEGDTHDPISFGEGGDEAPVASVEPEGAHEAHGGPGEPELTTRTGVGPGIFGHTPEDPQVGTKRGRLQGPAGGPEERPAKRRRIQPHQQLARQSPPATVEEEESGPRAAPLDTRGAAPREATQELI
ncbi:hypothetical protein CYMTET_9309 [Cymbomonas tetramitiformis]|uniref:Uncharacterized protein n=1 Tax=Cymbomonas tetramitiformis TaxID=36881 RepID=A0AAE0LF48_9CHLO|nr:hypothetical protein CYMTET_9309 [Cymbomonas tetramitiformis]